MEANANLPFEIRQVPSELNAQLLKDFTGERTGFVQVGPKKWFLPAKYREFAAHFYNFQPRPDDVWVVTFPRSGTTWTQELVWLVANDLDYETASRVPQVERFPFLEFNIFFHDEVKSEILELNQGDPFKQQLVELISEPAYLSLQEHQGRRFVKTHLPFSLLPPNLLDTCKVVYVVRNPKDVAVSFYHLNRLIKTQGYQGDFRKYWHYFEKDLHPWTPYWAHVEEGWRRRHHPNLLFQFYEDMNRDLSSTIRRMGSFLGKTMDEAQVARLADHLDIRNFRDNKAVNYDLVKEVGLLNSGEPAFIRKGKVGAWHAEFDEELDQRADKWIEENLRKTDIVFPISLHK
ncbi:sulfotransferase 1C4 [Neocloeon triangulifer]|uniref:sulfotransferase 1C4 n=1 Tax=Neocloeon triangulifer TaxID=2078957 RepID=UPI00286FA26B|nr:sulfotransferase 1C4 [Neocloeon triangulifer]